MIIAVTDRRICRPPFIEQIKLIASGKPDMLILREKDLPECEYGILARSCAEICSGYGVRLCINTFFDTARVIGVEDVQLPIEVLRGHASELDGLHVGASVHGIDDAMEAISLGAERLIFGHVFETSCKPGLEPRGLDALRGICEASTVPVFAIGGITMDNAGSVFDCGAAGICLMSSLMGADDPVDIIDQMKSLHRSKYIA